VALFKRNEETIQAFLAPRQRAQPNAEQGQMPLSLLILALSAFAIGTTEFVIMGLLPDVAADLGVSIPAPAGW
jgi:predicted MFS family arabinose efflux permease